MIPLRPLLMWKRLLLLVATMLLIAPSAGAVNLYLTDVAPFAYLTDKGGHADGINIRIAHELERRTGIPLNLIIVPTVRHLTLFVADKEAYSISHRENFSDTEGQILGDVTHYPIVVVARTETPITTVDDVIHLSQQKGIGMMRRMTYGTFGQDERIRKVEISTLENGLRMLQAGRISGVIGSLPALQAAAKKNGSDLQAEPCVVITHGAHVLRVRPAFAQTNTSRQLSAALAAMHADGYINRVVSDFLQPSKHMPLVE
ncbi:substrate-binding periplasmic protein [Undibacterium oligocarboniphilum]|uniref:Transporter substrate-binding domain-containing protein n=1 Tax=Undibacterium oligocarboniphilum TaxID=666702 RepID=A0A850QIZ5_9BURK|nr:transporter substrate-binding domain-containing protein [Undibacterium oligocarboniphilum]MBC3871554.1 transporter substrate-binding domain-containing protein [Undibacterium oligocarboniphilum]NVO79087.1 transporter substrate-binding domain-containing protein [Undibacterium oligocarboniphilum]